MNHQSTFAPNTLTYEHYLINALLAIQQEVEVMEQDRSTSDAEMEGTEEELKAMEPVDIKSFSTPSSHEL